MINSERRDTELDLIPHVLTPEGCAKNTSYRKFQLMENLPTLHMCVCEDHCSWEMCNLAHPPQYCLRNTGSNWNWDSHSDTWVAQVDLGNDIS